MLSKHICCRDSNSFLLVVLRNYHMLLTGIFHSQKNHKLAYIYAISLACFSRKLGIYSYYL